MKFGTLFRWPATWWWKRLWRRQPYLRHYLHHCREHWCTRETEHVFSKPVVTLLTRTEKTGNIVPKWPSPTLRFHGKPSAGSPRTTWSTRKFSLPRFAPSRHGPASCHCLRTIDCRRNPPKTPQSSHELSLR